MKPLLSVAAVAALAAALGCSDTTSPDPSVSAVAPADVSAPHGAGTLKVYTQNLYVGADVDALVEAIASGDQGAIFQALADAVATLHRTSFPTRAAAIVEEIDRERPDVVGLQEGSKIDVDLTPLQVPLVAHEDFLASLESALVAQGLTQYAVVDTVTNITVSFLGGLVQLIDYDVMLINTDRVTVTDSHKQNFVHNNGLFAGINFIRGFIEAQITVGGRDYVVFTTHTEGTDITPIVDYHQLHADQMQEIVDRADLVNVPAVVMGDLNDYQGSLMYDVMLEADFTDLWRTFHPGAAGFTCCHLSDLSDPNPRFGSFDERIDFVFTRGLEGPGRDAYGRIERYGLLNSDRLDGPDGTIWPSDHAGLVATLFLPASVARGH